jgi:hypothetical protein
MSYMILDFELSHAGHLFLRVNLERAAAEGRGPCRPRASSPWRVSREGSRRGAESAEWGPSIPSTSPQIRRPTPPRSPLLRVPPHLLVSTSRIGSLRTCPQSTIAESNQGTCPNRPLKKRVSNRLFQMSEIDLGVIYEVYSVFIYSVSTQGTCP